MPPGSLFFNSGVLLMDLEAWRVKEYCRKCIEFIQQYPERAIDADQDILNLVLFGDWLPLDYTWNVINPFFRPSFDLGLSEAERLRVCADAAIIHYNGGAKPWIYLDNHPRQREYFVEPEADGLERLPAGRPHADQHRPQDAVAVRAAPDPLGDQERGGGEAELALPRRHQYFRSRATSLPCTFTLSAGTIWTLWAGFAGSRAIDLPCRRRALERHILVHQRHDDLTVFGLFATADDHGVTIEDTGIDHGVAIDLERVMLAGCRAWRSGPRCANSCRVALRSADRRQSDHKAAVGLRWRR